MLTQTRFNTQKMTSSNDVEKLFRVSDRCRALLAKLHAFTARENFDDVERHIIADYSAKTGAERWAFVHPELERLKAAAKADGLWNLFVPKEFKQSPGLTNVEV